ncbi:MAG: LPS-assembly protein LptD [Bacteroidetes bacterium]|nr:LPS-assembly protein LptD [Bacteroidota bacterium]
MNNGRKINLKYIPALLLTTLFFVITLNSPANYSIRNRFDKILTRYQDTLPPPANVPKDTAIIKDSAARFLDSTKKDTTLKDTTIRKTDTFSFKVSKDTLDAPIAYTASDSVVLEVPTKNIILHNKANTKYKNMTLDAYRIKYDQSREVIIADFGYDTAKHVTGRPKMTSDESTVESDSIVFNMKTQKGITINSFTQSGEMFVMGEKMKKISPTDYYAFHGRFTTCNLDTPHFAFRTNKMKLVNKKLAVTGPVHPEFEGVPVPIYLPFGFFPISQGRHSGFLPPTLDVSPQFGLGLENMGYYKVFNDYLDVITRANLYSYGGWNLFITPEYRVRYRYAGRIAFTMQKTRLLSNSGKTEYDDNKTFSFSWGHSVDSKARPGTTFTANVNFMSTKFNQLVYNNPTANFNNQIGSSLAYSKTWNGKYNLTVSGTHSQNNQSKLININMPNVNFTAVTLYPFQRKEFVGTQKWYEKLGIGLTTNISGNTSFYDSLFSIHNLIDTFQWGAQHTIPITLSLPQLGPFQIAPGISWAEKWYSRRYSYTYNSATGLVVPVRQNGFFVANDVGFSLNISTAIFGTFTNFGKKSSILGLHHVIRPTIGITYKPDLAKNYYYNIQVNKTGQYLNLSAFDNTIYRGFSPGTFGGISFGLDNNLEMKVRSKSDTSESGFKKIKLIDGFGFTGSYNYLADSFKLSTLNFYVRSTLFNNVNVTGGFVVDPYITDSMGFRKNIYAWSAPGRKFSLGRITSGNLAISTSFKSKPKDPKKAETDKQALQQLPMTMEEQQSALDYMRRNPAEFVDFNVSWSLNVSYSLSFSSQLKSDFSGYTTTLNSGLVLSGDFNLTEKWKVTMSSYYDVKNLKINSLTGGLSRDMHCWQMSINVTPVGLWRSFNITINPKSGILRDLKVNRARSFQ